MTFHLKSFFFPLFSVFNWRLIALQYCVGFCHTTTWIRHVYTSPPLREPPSHTPGLSQSPGVSSLGSTANSPWPSTFHVLMYVSPRYSLHVSHWPPPPLCPETCALCLCLCSCPASSFISTILSRFHSYALIYDICFSHFRLTSLCVTGSKFIHLTRTDSNVFLSMTEQYSIVYIYIYIPQLL